MKPIKIISHRRSGTHFLWETMRLNFSDQCFGANIESNALKWHRLPERSPIEDMIEKNNCIHILRDCRDTLVSTWRWWMSGAEPYYGILPIIQGSTFSQFLHGVPEWRLKHRKKIGEVERHLLDPIKVWMEYSEWSDIIFTVRFEDLKFNLKETMYEIRDEFGFHLNSEEPKPINRLVGWQPWKGKVGGWAEYFTDEDEEYFWNKAGEKMTELGYRR